MWNANGILGKRDELSHFMDTEQVAAILISETHLQPQIRFSLANHLVYRTDRPHQPKTRCGGTAVMVRGTIRHHEIAIPPLQALEATGVELLTPGGALRVFAVYSAPGAKLHMADIDALLDSDQPTIICGDLNAKHTCWNSRVSNTRGKQLLAHSRLNDFLVAGPLEPTHYQGNLLKPDVLDIVLTKNLAHSMEVVTLPALSSDHNPVLVTIGDELSTHHPVPKRNFRKADWKKFSAELSCAAEPLPLGSPDAIDAAASKFSAAVNDAIAASVPLSTPKRCSIYDLPPGLMASIAEKNRARRLWQRHRIPSLHTRYNMLTKLLKDQIRDFRSQRWEEAVSELREGDNSIWRMTRRLTNRPEPSPPIQGRTHLACSARDKAEALAESLESQFQPNPPSAITTEIEQAVATHRAEHPPQAQENAINTCSVAEVTLYISELCNGKAPGQDGITNTVIKMLPPPALHKLVDIYNACLRLQHFPSVWKEAKVIVFPKPGKPLRDPTSYRPISLLSCLSKLLEKIALRRLQEHADVHKVIIHEQFGFRREHSTNHQLLRVVDKITHGFNTNKITGIVFLDVAKAFDRVWHDGLLFKLITLKFPDYLVNFVASFLHQRSFHVSLRHEKSLTRPISAGVPQGSIMAPFLFNVFTNDVPRDFPGVDTALYADDAAIIAQSWSGVVVERNLQSALDSLSSWYANWRIMLNASKTTATLFSHKRVKHHPELTLSGETITWEPSSLYLGVLLDSKLSWRAHVERTQQRAVGKIAALFPLLRSKSMDASTKTRIYTAIIRPTLTYASPVWSGCSARLRETLQRVQNRAARLALGVPMYARTADVHQQLDLDFLDHHLLHLNKAFYEKLADSDNPLIQQLSGIAVNPFDRYPRPIAALEL